MHQLEFGLTLCAALGSGLMAGTFFAFSAFVMTALGRLPAEAGITAMTAINTVVLNPVFLGVFLGTALVSTVLAVMAFAAWPSAASGWRLAGGLIYLLGCVLITMACNVPLNRELARVAVGGPEAAAVWAAYQSKWTAWNHVRTLAPLVALGCFIMALRAAV